MDRCCDHRFARICSASRTCYIHLCITLELTSFLAPAVSPMDTDCVQSDRWSGKLVFTEFDHRGSVNIQSEWTHSCLRTDLLAEEICGRNNITLVRLYKEQVNPATNALIHPAFVVFKTEGRWKYSIEKNRTCILLQRSKCMNDVLHSFCGGVAETHQQIGKGSIGKVVHFLWRNNHLGEPYHPQRSDSMLFALRIFKAFSFQNCALTDHVNNSSDDDPDHFEY